MRNDLLSGNPLRIKSPKGFEPIAADDPRVRRVAETRGFLIVLRRSSDGRIDVRTYEGAKIDAGKALREVQAHDALLKAGVDAEGIPPDPGGAASGVLLRFKLSAAELATAIRLGSLTRHAAVVAVIDAAQSSEQPVG